MRRKCACQHHGEGHHGPHICEQVGFSVGDYLTAVVLREISKKADAWLRIIRKDITIGILSIQA
jgi:hypothetical protein